MNNEFNVENNNYAGEEKVNNNNINNQNGNNKNDKWKDTLILVLVIIVFILTVASLYLVIDKKNNNGVNSNNNKQEQNNGLIDNNDRNKDNVQEENKDDKDNSNVDNKEQGNDNKKDDNLDLVDFNEASLALNSFKKLYINKEKLYNLTYEIKNITKKEIIGTAVANLDSKLVGFYGVGDNFESSANISVQELMNIISKLIVNKEEISIEDIKTLCVNQEDLCGDKIVKVEENNIKVYNYPHGMSDEIVKYDKFVKAEKNKENLYVYMKTAFRKFGLTNDGIMTYTYYKDYNGNEMIEQIFEDEGKEPNWNLYNTYKYTFKIKNSNYYFEKIELLK